jgi:hypothetical protein
MKKRTKNEISENLSKEFVLYQSLSRGYVIGHCKDIISDSGYFMIDEIRQTLTEIPESCIDGTVLDMKELEDNSTEKIEYLFKHPWIIFSARTLLNNRLRARKLRRKKDTQCECPIS